MMDFNIVLFYGVPAKNLICKLAKNLQGVSTKLTGSYYSTSVWAPKGGYGIVVYNPRRNYCPLVPKQDTF